MQQYRAPHQVPPRQSSSPMLARNKVPDQVSVGHQTSFLLYSARVVQPGDRLDDPGQHQPPEHLVREAARQKRSLPNDTTLHVTGLPEPFQPLGPKYYQPNKPPP